MNNLEQRLPPTPECDTEWDKKQREIERRRMESQERMERKALE